MNDPIRTEKLGVFTVKIFSDPDPINPRSDYDNFGKMSCLHRRYCLGDSPYNLNADDLKGIIDNPETISLPLYLYDHSGITMKCSPYSCQFDSGQVGYIYVSVKDAEKEFSTKDRSYDSWLDMVRSCLAAEVEAYDDYLTGNCYGYTIEDQSGNEIESCWGFLGDEKYCIDEALSSAQHFNNKLLAKHELACI